MLVMLLCYLTKVMQAVDGKMNLLVSLQEALQEVEDDLEAAHRMVNQCTSSVNLISNGQPSTQVGHDIYIFFCVLQLVLI